MSVKPVLARLLRLRELEEEQSRLELEAAVAAQGSVERERNAVAQRQASERRAFVAGVEGGDYRVCTGAIVEMEQARSERGRIEVRLAGVENEVRRQREEFIARRTSRKQVSTLVDAAREESEVEVARRVQQMLDDWYGRRGPKR